MSINMLGLGLAHDDEYWLTGRKAPVYLLTWPMNMLGLGVAYEYVRARVGP